ncbi:MAG: winged helix-turn-helix transcriptional regulator [Austwickia sp.]|nr:winged helix-turn-helix transcriptional regulator [Austwickia sp.]MBK8437642.1 winged helix-turn-helix transcriptional regulator [Austwickia sp.]MBK9102910.1 winged helix-turn-helix transcriptional regulator [Austwickia sp.]
MALTTGQAGALTKAFVRSLRAAKTLLRIAPKVESTDLSSQAMMFRLVSGPHRVSDLAEATFCDVSVASRGIRSLVAHGLVAKDHDPTDRRVALISLTDHGRRQLEATMHQRATFMAEVLQGWSAHDAATFTALLERFADDLERRMADTSLPQASGPQSDLKDPA